MQIKSMIPILLIGLTFSCFGCAPRSIQPTGPVVNEQRNYAVNSGLENSPSPFPAPSPLDRSIRTIDFQNFTFPWFPKEYSDYFGNRRELSVRDGRLVANHGDDAAEFTVAVEVEYFDLTGDGKEEAIVNLSVLLPNRAMPSCIFVYEIADSKVRLLWKYESGRRDAKGFKNFKNDAGKLVIEEFNILDSPLCCPKSFYRTVFEWKNNTFEILNEDSIPYDRPNRLDIDAPDQRN